MKFAIRRKRGTRTPRILCRVCSRRKSLSSVCTIVLDAPPRRTASPHARGPSVVGVVASSLTRPPKSQRAWADRHHENIRPSLSLFLLRPCRLRGLKCNIERVHGREITSARKHGHRTFGSRPVLRTETRRAVKAALFAAITRTAQSAPREIIKRERAAATRERHGRLFSRRSYCARGVRGSR